MLGKMVYSRLQLVLHKSLQNYMNLIHGSVTFRRVYTLQERLVDFLRSDNRYKMNTVNIQGGYQCDLPSAFIKICDSTETRSVSDIQKNIPLIPFTQLPQIIFHIGKCKHKLPFSSFQALVSYADEECTQYFSVMDKQLVLKTLDAWYYALPSELTRTNFYSTFVRSASHWLPEVSMFEDLIQPVFYVGLSKNMPESSSIMRKFLNEIGKLIPADISSEEICIILTAALKTRTPIKSNNLLKHMCHVLNAQCENMLADQSVFVTCIKSLRHAKFHNYHTLDKIARTLFHNKQLMSEMNFTAKVHLLALYADALYIRDFIPVLIEKCEKDLCHNVEAKRNEYFTTNRRVKDVSRFLWAMSYLGYTLSEDVATVLEQQLQERMSQNELLRNPEHFIGILLSLWVMGHTPVNLFKRVVTPDTMNQIKRASAFRYKARLSLLLTCAHLEAPEVLVDFHHCWDVVNQIPQRAVDGQFQTRKMLQKVYTALQCLSHHLKLQVCCECSVPNLNIVGITVATATGEIWHVEVLDSTVCLHNSFLPHGLMSLKLRLLRNMEHNVLLVSEDHFHLEKDSSELYTFLEDKLRSHENRR